jgi:hypothetical protein
MTSTYKGTLRGNSIEWDDEAPAEEGPVPVEVTLVSGRKTDGKKLREALEALAAAGGVRSIPDPIAWQREIRRDRPLHGRD